jgi:predicted phosphodiesterase
VRCLLLADVHANLPALEAVLADAGTVDAVWCLGDVVGLGAEPEGCVERLRGLAALGVAGNHDLAAVGNAGPELRRTPFLGESNRWTRERLSAGSLAYLGELPRWIEVEEIRLVHDQTELSGRERVALVGHTHLPFLRPPGAVPTPGERLALGDEPVVLNPGPVGAPDWRPGRACYARLEIGSRRAVEATVRVVAAPAGPGEDEIARLDAPPRLVAYWRRLNADAALADGEIDRARELFRSSTTLFRDGRDARQALHLLVGLADLAAAEGDVEQAAALLGAAMPDHDAAHPAVRHRVALAAAALRSALGEGPFEAARQRGRGMGLEAALRLAGV